LERQATRSDAASASGVAGASIAQARRLIRRLAPLLVLIGLAVALIIANPNFIGWGNVVRILNSAAVPVTIAAGLTFVILMGSIDLSVEGTLSVAAMVTVLLARNDLNSNNLGWLAAVLAILSGCFLGLTCGVIQTGLRIPSFMATLGMWFVGLGFSVFMLGGSAVRLMDPQLRVIALSRFLDMPLTVWIGGAAVLLAFFIERYTSLGRHIFALGGGEDIAAFSGVNVKRVRIAAFTLAGFFYGVAGVLAAAQLGQSNAVIGDGRLFTAITGVVVGGTALTGGEGGVLDTLVGVLIVAVLANGMILLGVSPYVQQTLMGLMIIIAVGLSIDRERLRIVK
jgi:ribose transport system permease protein